MSEAERTAARRDAFTLSMVDLFGCGFIAATFLFILNMLQPQLDAEERGGSLAAAVSGQAGAGQSGPAFVSIVSSQKLDCIGQETPSAEAPFRYDYVVADSAEITWPYMVNVCLTDPTVAATVDLRFTFSGQTAGMGIAGWSDGQPIDVRFSLNPKLTADIDREWDHALRVDLLTRGSGRAAYSGRFVFRSPSPIAAAVKWSGKVDTLKILRGDGSSESLSTGDPDADCAVVFDQVQGHEFAYCGAAADNLPEPGTELSGMSSTTFGPGDCLSKTSLGAEACLPTVEQNCALLAGTSCGPLQNLTEPGGLS